MHEKIQLTIRSELLDLGLAYYIWFSIELMANLPTNELFSRQDRHIPHDGDS